MLEIKNLKTPAIGPISLTISTAEIVALSGPSGAGKSLLLRAIADLDPAEGTVRLEGRDRADFLGPEWRRRVALVPAESGWWADRVGAHFAGDAKTYLTDLGLDPGVLDWEVARLSTGERQRVALARALIARPAVLLLDEPTAGLDRDTEALAEAVIRGERARGAAILIVTHDPAQAQRLADRRIAIVAGRLAAAAA